MLNYLVTNRFIPRRAATRFVGWLSRVEQPLVRDLSIAAWRLFSDLDLSEAKELWFKSLRDCFIRELRDGARPVDPDAATLVSPCDGIVIAAGRVTGGELLQVKGSRYPLAELLGGDDALADAHAGGLFATLRLTAAMYHRFHAPADLRLEGVRHLPGDAFNVNPPTLARVPRLYCRNERVVLRTRLAAGGQSVTLVPVAAVLVAGIRLRLGERVIDPRHGGPLPTGGTDFRKGQEMGWFEHGSTIVILAPAPMALAGAIRPGAVLRMGQPLLTIGGGTG